MADSLPFDKGIPCENCNDTLFICKNIENSFLGIRYYSCPICGKGEFDPIISKIDDLNYNPPRNGRYCTNCKLIFHIGCIHYINSGPDDDIPLCHCSGDYHYFSRFVSNYELDGKIYDGYPMFKDYNDFLTNIGKYKLNWICTCKGKSSNCIKTKHRVSNTCKYDNLESSYKDPNSNLNQIVSRTKIKIDKEKHEQNSQKIFQEKKQYSDTLQQAVDMVKQMNPKKYEKAQEIGEYLMECSYSSQSDDRGDSIRASQLLMTMKHYEIPKEDLSKGEIKLLEKVYGERWWEVEV